MSLVAPISVSLKSEPKIKGLAIADGQILDPTGHLIRTLLVCFDDDDGTLAEIPVTNLRWEEVGFPDDAKAFKEEQGPEEIRPETPNTAIPSA